MSINKVAVHIHRGKHYDLNLIKLLFAALAFAVRHINRTLEMSTYCMDNTCRMVHSIKVFDKLAPLYQPQLTKMLYLIKLERKLFFLLYTIPRGIIYCKGHLLQSSFYHTYWHNLCCFAIFGY